MKQYPSFVHFPKIESIFVKSNSLYNALVGTCQRQEDYFAMIAVLSWYQLLELVIIKKIKLINLVSLHNHLKHHRRLVWNTNCLEKRLTKLAFCFKNWWIYYSQFITTTTKTVRVQIPPASLVSIVMPKASRQSYNGLTIINYDSRVIPDFKIAHFITLES